MTVILFCQQGFGEVCLDTIYKLGIPCIVFVPIDQFKQSTSLAKLCNNYGIEMVPAPSLSSVELEKIIRSLEADLLISATYPERFPKTLLALPKKGAINLHPSLLPDYRGADPCFWVIRHGEQKTGLTIHYMDHRFDHGSIIHQSEIGIESNETGGSIFLKTIARIPTDLGLILADVLERGNRLLGIVQTKTSDKKAPRVTGSMLQIDPKRSCQDNLRLIRAANPSYGAWTTINGKLVKIWQAKATPEPKKTIAIDENHGVFSDGTALYLKCDGDWIVPEVIQIANFEVATNTVIYGKYFLG